MTGTSPLATVASASSGSAGETAVARILHAHEGWTLYVEYHACIWRIRSISNTDVHSLDSFFTLPFLLV